ncbi:hypothetical protein FJZ40_05280 [Candidatus Shapirobacteria bacterium]|nr:hypothetical protein [Candidatus Shapirobacteria bacterium]
MKAKELARFTPLLFFTKESLRSLEKNEDSLNSNLKYWLKKGVILSLKKGFYVLKERWEKELARDLYLEYLANKLYEPSYLSSEYVMGKYSLLTEAVYTLTSVTPKTTRSFKNRLGFFNYYSISSRLFEGFEIKKFSSAPILIAKKPKAVFDFLYLRFLKSTPVNEKEIAELRVNWENINEKEFREIQAYARLTQSKRVKETIGLIKRMYYA